MCYSPRHAHTVYDISHQSSRVKGGAGGGGVCGRFAELLIVKCQSCARDPRSRKRQTYGRSLPHTAYRTITRASRTRGMLSTGTYRTPRTADTFTFYSSSPPTSNPRHRPPQWNPPDSLSTRITFFSVPSPPTFHRPHPDCSRGTVHPPCVQYSTADLCRNQAV